MQTNEPQIELEAGLKRLTDPAVQASLQTDAELLELYLYGGRHDAMVTLVQRFAPLVASVVRRVVSHPQDAEDAFQATFVILLKSARSIRSRRSIAAWLYGVAYRTACRVRAKSRRGTVPLGDIDMPDIDSEQNPIVELSRQIELSSLDRELQNLPDGLREPVVEHYILGHSARQIADRMELSTSAIEGRLRRGRRLLRHRLAIRGTSLSVVVSGAAWLRDHSTTANACDQWTNRMLEFSDSNSSTSPDSFLSADPYITQLVHGELAMRLSPLLKPLGLLTAATVMTVSLSVFALAPPVGGRVNQASVDPSGGLPESVAAPSDETVLRPTVSVANNDPRQPAEAKPPEQPRTMGAQHTVTMPRQSTNSFVRPSGDAPGWLSAGATAIDTRERLRHRTRDPVQFDFTGQPLSDVLTLLGASVAIDIVIDQADLESMGVDPDAPVTRTLKGGIPLSDALELILEPFGLMYEIHDHFLKIVSQDSTPEAIRYYDLAFVLPTSDSIDDLVRTIQATVSPEIWDGTSTIGVIGSMMVVNCNEKTHRQIERLLAQLAKMDPQNLRASTGVGPFSGTGLGGMGGDGAIEGGGIGGGLGAGRGGGGMF